MYVPLAAVVEGHLFPACLDVTPASFALSGQRRLRGTACTCAGRAGQWSGAEPGRACGAAGPAELRGAVGRERRGAPGLRARNTAGGELGEATGPPTCVGPVSHRPSPSPAPRPSRGPARPLPSAAGLS